MSVERSLESLGLSSGDPEEIFDIHSREGAGAFGQVFRASYRSTRKEAALKVIQIALKPGQYGEDVDNVRREIEFLRECDHQNVVAFYGAYYKDGALWIAMEYCGGGSVGDISRQRRLCEQEISVIMRGALEGLAHLHSKKKIHRDVKGGNILLTTDGNVKIADFGVSAQLRDTLSRRGTFVGTPYWMSPEMIQDSNYDYKADIWSLGITAIELADQRPPLFDEHPMRVLIQIPRNPPPRLKQPQDWSANFSHFVQYCLTKSPADRPTAVACLAHPFIMCWRDIPRVVPGGGGVLHRTKSNLHEGPEQPLPILPAVPPSSMPTIPESDQSNASTLDDLITAAQAISDDELDDNAPLDASEVLGADCHEASRSSSSDVSDVVIDRLLAMVPPNALVDDESVLLEASSSAVSEIDVMDDLISMARTSSMEPGDHVLDNLDDDNDTAEVPQEITPTNSNNSSTNQLLAANASFSCDSQPSNEEFGEETEEFGEETSPGTKQAELHDGEKADNALVQPNDDACAEAVDQPPCPIDQALPSCPPHDAPSPDGAPADDEQPAPSSSDKVKQHPNSPNSSDSDLDDDDGLPPTSELPPQPEIEPILQVEIKPFVGGVADIASSAVKEGGSPPPSPTHSAPTTFVGTPFRVAHDVCVRYNTYDAKYEGVPASFGQLHKHFGIPLAQMRCSTKHPDDLVPALLRMLRRELGESGVTAKYIYRSSPDHGQIQAAKLALNAGMFDGSAKRNDPYLLSSLIKCWFRELPEPLLAPCCKSNAAVTAVTSLVMKEAGSTDVSLRCDFNTLDAAIRKFLSPLSNQARQIFEWLVEHWCEVVDKHTLNMMSSHSLAIVWVPNLITMSTTSTQEASRVSNQVAMILQVCILWRQQILQANAALVAAKKQPSVLALAIDPTPPSPLEQAAPPKALMPLYVDGKLFHARTSLVRTLALEMDRMSREKWSFVECQRHVLNLLRLHARTRQEREFADKLLQNPATKPSTQPATLHDCARWIDIAMDAVAFAEFQAQQRDVANQLNQVFLVPSSA
ncbi:hypothetical protein DYB32_002819 [Aphanomyces invadans]|uniref:STE/STE20/MST protein kinase n=1 Tax=Aphanomyces invadans TaxID=157072 RepID=A0A3R7AC49_9STRA|nr:hypothetical protein DYB32_002819 [Aphanomyces invadans]